MRPPFDLIVISDGGPALLPRLEGALAGAAAGRVAVLLRERALPAAALLELVRAARVLTRRSGAALLVSDRIDVALLGEADGVHLPEAGLSVTEARSLLGAGRLVGASRHDRQGVHAACEAGADYATLSPVYGAPGKGEPLTLAGFGAIARTTSLPLFALGGVGADAAAELVHAGAAGVAVMREGIGARDPASAVRGLLNALDAARPADGAPLRRS